MPISAARPLLKKALRPLAMFGLELGIDPRRLINLGHLGRFLRDYRRFKARGGLSSNIYPVLCDYGAKAGSASGHYFHQDLLVARKVFASSPRRHVDVASRLDGFVSHVAAFREIEVIDIRPLEKPGHENIRFIQADVMNLDPAMIGTADSVSCLHALEHFGLGRYGDEIDPDGHLRGFASMAAMLEPGGHLYLSVPISTKRRVEFNAQRVFWPYEPLDWSDMEMEAFDYVDDAGALVRDADPQKLPPLHYGCGIYTFRA